MWTPENAETPAEVVLFHNFPDHTLTRDPKINLLSHDKKQEEGEVASDSQDSEDQSEGEGVVSSSTKRTASSPLPSPPENKKKNKKQDSQR